MTNQTINHEELIYDPDHDETIDQQSLPNTENNPENETLETQEAAQAQNTQSTQNTEQLAQENKETTLPKTVPYQRFQQKVHEANELNQKYRELELELARLQGAASANQNKPTEQPTNQTPEINIKQLRRDYYEAMAIGDDEKALEIQETIDDYNDKINQEKALKIAQRVINEREEATLKQQQQTIQQQNKKLIDEFMVNYDYLNDESANFDPDAFEVFSAFFKSAIDRGNKTFKESLDYAVNKVVTLTNKTSPVAPKKTTLTQKQIEQQLQRVQQATPQIAKKGTAGNDIVIDPADMTEEEYEKFRDGGGKFDFEG